MQKTSHFLDWLILASLVVAWGSSFAMTKVAVAYLDAAWIMALRLSIAALILVPYAWISGKTLRAPIKIWWKFSLLALIGHAAPFYLITWGTHYVASGVSGLLMGAIPLFLVVLAHFFLPGEPLTLPKSAGFLLGFAGIVVLLGPKTLFTLSLRSDELIGEVAILAACLCYAIHGIIAKRMGIEDPVKQTASVCLAAALMGLTFAMVTSPASLAGVAPIAIWSVIGLGILPTAIATLLMYRLIHRSGPSFVAYSNYLVPVYAVILGAVLLSEPLNWNVALALLLILLGIAISRRSLPPNRRLQHEGETPRPASLHHRLACFGRLHFRRDLRSAGVARQRLQAAATRGERNSIGGRGSGASIAKPTAACTASSTSTVVNRGARKRGSVW